MILLGFDTATPATAVALRTRDAEEIGARDDPPAGQRPRHTSDLLVLAAKLMAEAQIGWRDLDGIAVGLGPGTFTGLRVGVATARALAQSLDIKLLGISSLRALAEPALSQRPEAPALAVLDARRGEAFIAAYAREGGEAIELIAPRAVRPEQLAGVLEELRASGARREGALAVGDGAILFRSELTDAGARVPADDSTLHLLRASSVCEIGLRDRSAQAVEQVLPLYGRRPDAEIAIEAASR